MSDKFQVLSDREHILKRPSMYIGSIDYETKDAIISGKVRSINVVPGLLKIINEIIDNSVDEFVRTEGKHANIIKVSISENNEVCIEDNGRGIPIEKYGDKGEYRPVLAWNSARAGTNFGEDRVTLGANGVGSYCTNLFSTSFVGQTSTKDKTLSFKSQINASIVSTATVRPNKTGKTGTKVTFTPDLGRFNMTTIDQDFYAVIKDRLENLSMCYPGLKFTFNGETLKVRSPKDFANRFKQTEDDEVIVIDDKNNTLIITSSGISQDFKYLSYVNGLNNENGGNHLDYIVGEICKPLREFIEKKHKIEVQPARIKSGLLVAVYSRNFENLKFTSQTKDKIANSITEVKSQYGDIDFEKIAKTILKTPSIIDPIISAILFKKQQEEQLALARAAKSNKNKRVLKHIPAQSKNAAEKTLFIAEGQSAIGQLVAVRDPKTIGGYPLKGKILNVRKSTPSEIIKNAEISDLMSIIGLEFGKDPENLNYGRIVTLTDADTDGYSIACLLFNFFAFWPKLFEDGKVYMCMTPLYICRKGKTVKFFYNKHEFDAFNTRGYEVEYIKGLGSLPKEVYKEVVNNPKLVKITADLASDFEKLEMAFGDDVSKRKEWMLERQAA